MSTIRTLVASVLFASVALSASAQAQPTSGASATAPDPAASPAQTKKLPKHNHGAEKNN